MFQHDGISGNLFHFLFLGLSLAPESKAAFRIPDDGNHQNNQGSEAKGKQDQNRQGDMEGRSPDQREIHNLWILVGSKTDHG